ncbi:hypothetical protein BD408DRAFT_337567 [Parasitella parasitica]|nr:hypothetical protein BD408DRAFT_337567 [Parasitella parasitica]
MNSTSAEIVKTYDWQCNDCKSCLVCQSKNDEGKIVICNHCDRGYHTFCCDPPLRNIPKGNFVSYDFDLTRYSVKHGTYSWGFSF